MHEEQFRVHNLDIDEFSKRNAQLNEQNIRLDIECGRLTDELQIALSRLEQLRNDCANLRAEKKIWEVSDTGSIATCDPRLNYPKGIQGRLVEENRNLSMERSHLADLMGNVQKMHNDLERSGENDRRRLEGQLQMLENQTFVV
jgi:nucleoprotein TPR